MSGTGPQNAAQIRRAAENARLGRDPAPIAAPGTPATDPVSVLQQTGGNAAVSDLAGASRRSTRTAPSDESFADAGFDTLLHDLRNSDFGSGLEAAKRAAQPELPEDTTRTRAQVDAAAHAQARQNPPPGRVPGAQIQHQTKTLDVTRNLPPGMKPLAPSAINENLLWLQSRKNLPATQLHVDPNGGGTTYHADDVPRGREGDEGMRGEQLDLFAPSSENGAQTYNTEHKFTDNYLIPSVATQIAASRERAGLPPLDPRMLAIAAGEQSRWMMSGESGSSRSGSVVDIAAAASARSGTNGSSAPISDGQLSLPFGAQQEPGALAAVAQHAPPPVHEAPPVHAPPPVHEAPPVQKPPPQEHVPAQATTSESHAGDSALHVATQAANEFAGVLRGSDAYDDARKSGKGVVASAFQGGKTYLQSTNVVAGSVANYEAKRADGQDPIEAGLSTFGETLGGYLVPGKGIDQGINAAANVTDAVDDHLGRGAPGAAHPGHSTTRNVADLAADLTPSKMMSETLGAGLRSYWDIGKAIGGDTTGVDKFGRDALHGKLGAVFQPWAMAADFAGNLGSGEGAGKALDKTLAATKGTTLDQIASSGADALFNAGQSDAAKSGKYSTEVQGLAMLSSTATDLINGKSLGQALKHSAEPGKDTLLGQAVTTGVDVAARVDTAAREKIGAVESKAAELKAQATDKLANWRDRASNYLSW